MPSQCDDGPFGHGTGGQLRYDVKLKGRGSTTLWVAVAGSENSAAEARGELAELLDDPGGPARRRSGARAGRSRATRRLDLPGDRQLQNSIDWGKQNLADLTQVAKDVDIRWTNQGKEWTHEGDVARIALDRRRLPGLPVAVRRRRRVHRARRGNARPVRRDRGPHAGAARDLRHPQRPLGRGRARGGGRRVGLVRQGLAPRPSDGVVKYDFNTDEIVKFPGAVALIWRWTGDNAFRDDMLDFTWRNLEYVRTKLDADGDGWPEGNGNVERDGMGEEKLDNAVYYIRGLYDFADMARSAGQATRADAAEARADALAARFEDAWWIEADQQYADSLRDPGNAKVNQKHWIGVDPMEVELFRDGEFEPGPRLRRARLGARSPRARTTATAASGPATAACSTPAAAAGRPVPASSRSSRSNTGIQAVGEGNYGRLGAEQQRRYTDANAETQFSEPATAGTPDEQPGAMPEIMPSAPPGGTPRPGRHPAEHRPLLDLPVDVHAGVGPLRHRVGGRAPAARRAAASRPRLARGRPAGARRAAAASQGANIRLGGGSADVLASHDGARYTTTTDTQRRAGAGRSGSGTRCRAARRSRRSSSTARRWPTTTRARPTAASRCASPPIPTGATRSS